MEYIPTIGLEIHAELKTRTKMFCGSKNDPDEDRPNVNVCPVCMAHPGTLPVINREAVAHVLRMGVAIQGRLADYTEFDRKNYFYPDLPKGYQISQYEHPLVSGGTLNQVAITRIHLEEDTARSQHDPKTGATFVDFNRAGVPLMELVTEPVIHSAADAADFARELQILLRYLGAGDANMEKGEMRVEANISVAPEGGLGTKVEVKNLNSFRSVERAIEHEVKRQIEVISQGGTVAQETRVWDEAAQKTFSQRIKEGSADYRYFPDPDLPKLVLSALSGLSNTTEIAATLPELPKTRYERYIRLGIAKDDAGMYVREPALGGFFDTAVKTGGWSDPAAIRLASNYIATDLTKMLRDSEKRETGIEANSAISPENFAHLMQMVLDKKVSSRGAKDILSIMFREGGSPQVIADKHGLNRKGDSTDLLPIVQKVIKENTSVAEAYKAGKIEVIKFLVGQGMKATKGAADPQALRELFIKALHT